SFSSALHGGYLPSALRGANPWGSPRAPEDNRPLQPHRVALAISMGDTLYPKVTKILKILKYNIRDRLFIKN
ncbi:MAG: hypothetical protein IJ394_09775, partial [Bacteroidales bacterium]|nr:hypothetical protein [Bacteroidales bacterium]